MQKIKNRFKLAMTALVMGTMVMVTSPMTTKADEQVLIAKIETLKTKFPMGKFWNHVGMNVDNSDGFTDKGCSLHKAEGVSHVYGTGGCTCNHFSDKGHLSATQCMGFANKLGHDVFGDTSWIKYNNPNATQKASIRVGDIVRLTNHSVFVIAKSGNVITIAEANYPNNCQINWGRQVDLTTTAVEYYEHAANYDAIAGGGQPTTEQPSTQQPATTEQPKTEQPTTEQPIKNNEWVKAADGVHYQYYIDGKLQKSTWISSKKYYVDANGYRVSGMVEIQGDHYYFDANGLKQKKKWIEYNGKDYYLCKSGAVLKNQWWYKGDVWVFVKKDGSVAKSELVKIGKKKYAFDANGKRSKGFKKIGSKYYYTGSDGVIYKKKWIKVKKKTYYVDKKGVRVTLKIAKIGSYQYYFDKKGRLVKNKKVTFENIIYKANRKGRLKKIGVVEATTESNASEATTEAAHNTTEAAASTTQATTEKEASVN